jgi:hypothetical protein
MFLFLCYNRDMSNNPTFTLHLKSVGDHLEVTIPELNITVSTRPGETSRDAALDAGHRAIIEYHLKQREARQVR